MRQFLFVLFALIYSAQSYAEPIAIGTSLFDGDDNLIEDAGPAGLMVRSLTQVSLMRATATEGEYELFAADGLKVSVDYSKWSFRIKPLKFQNGDKVSAEDVAYSLNSCPSLKNFAAYKGADARTETLGDGRKLLWVDARLELPAETGTIALDFESKLAACSIVPERESVLFSGSFGRGTNIFGAGSYKVSSFVPGKALDMVRVADSVGLKPPTEAVSLRGFSEAKEALTALRLGTIAAFIGQSKEILTLAGDDPTLVASSCQGFNVLARKGFTFSCTPSLDIMTFRYET